MMKTIVVVLVALVACGKSAEEQAKEDVAKQAAKDQSRKVEPAAVQKGSAAPAPAPEAKPKEPEAPEPTTPEEIENARKAAMNAQDIPKAMKYCDMSKLDDKSDPQKLLGCTLAACRSKNEDKARAWAKPLPKKYLDNAKPVCLKEGIGL